MHEVPIWREGREHRSLDQSTVTSYRGEPVGRVHQAPALLVHPLVAGLRKVAPVSGQDLPRLWDAIARAGEALDRENVGGFSPAEHARMVTLATGAPVSDAQRGLTELADALRRIRYALGWQAPGGELATFRERRIVHPDGRGCAWVPAGEVLGFIAPSNHPAVHFSWVLALAMGWTVAVRPGSDDPFTPWRLLQALAAAGFPMERVALLPGPHEMVQALVAACDRTVAYGGAELGRLLGRDGRVLFNGPGHSKVLVDLPPSTPWLPEFLVEAILHDGGRKCTCASAVVVMGGGGALLDEVGDRLAALPLLDPLDPAARVPAWKSAEAVVRTPAEPEVVAGVAFARPALVKCPAPVVPPFGLELPAPWATGVELPQGRDPLPVLRGSLAVTLLSRRQELREACLREPTIRKLFTGPIPPWHSEPGAPHQGRLSEFLFTSKAAPEVEGEWTWPGAGPS